MKITDYIAFLALVVSLGSAWISIRSWRFNVKVKSLELRSLLLASLHNALVKAENTLADYRLCKNTSLDAKEIELFKRFTKEQTIQDIIEKIRSRIEEVEAASGHGAVDLYGRSVSLVTAVTVRIDDLANDVATLKTGLMARLLKEKELPPA